MLEKLSRPDGVQLSEQHVAPRTSPKVGTQGKLGWDVPSNIGMTMIGLL